MAAEAAAPAVSSQELTVRYGREPALLDVSFEVPAGATVALLGPNGAGKTTLFKLLATLILPEAGTIEVAGINALQRPDAQQDRDRDDVGDAFRCAVGLALALAREGRPASRPVRRVLPRPERDEDDPDAESDDRRPSSTALGCRQWWRGGWS